MAVALPPCPGHKGQAVDGRSGGLLLEARDLWGQGVLTHYTDTVWHNMCKSNIIELDFLIIRIPSQNISIMWVNKPQIKRDEKSFNLHQGGVQNKHYFNPYCVDKGFTPPPPYPCLWIL